MSLQFVPASTWPVWHRFKESRGYDLFSPLIESKLDEPMINSGDSYNRVNLNRYELTKDSTKKYEFCL